MSNLESLKGEKFRVLEVEEAREVLGGLQAAAAGNPTLIGGTFLPGGVFILDYTPDASGPAPEPAPKEQIA